MSPLNLFLSSISATSNNRNNRCAAGSSFSRIYSDAKSSKFKIKIMENQCLHSLRDELRAKNPEEIYLQTADGRTVYWPKENMGRLAPAAVVSAASRVVALRKFLKDNEETLAPDLCKKIEYLCRPIDFEDQFLSGNSLKIHNAIVDSATKKEDIYG